MRAGVIGVGSMGENHARVYSEMKLVDDVAVFDVDQGKAQAVAEKYDCTPFDSLPDLLRYVDLVSICTPTPTHHEMCRNAGQFKVPFLCEKPVADSIVHAAEVRSYAAGCVKSVNDVSSCGVGHIERFNPLVSAIKSIIHDPRYVAIRRHNPGSYRITDTSVVDDLMIHDIDLLLHVLFPGVVPSSIKSEFTHSVASVLFNFGGAVATVSASRLGSEKIRDIYIEDDGFTLIGDFMTQELLIYRRPADSSYSAGQYHQENVCEKVIVPKVEPLRAELRTFIDCVRSGHAFPVTVAQAIANMEVAEVIKSDSLHCNCGNGGCR